MTLPTFLAISAGFLYAVTNVIDKIIVGKHITKPIMVVIYSGFSISVFGLFMLPFAASITITHALILFVNALITLIAVTLYFTGIKYEEPSRVVPLLGFITIFIALLSAIFLNEIFNSITYLGIISIILGSWTITARQHILSPFKSRVFGIIIFSSFLWALKFVIDKYLLAFYPPVTIISYQFIFQGPLVLLLAIKYFEEIKEVWRQKKKYVFLQWLNEAIAVGAIFSYLIAASLWYVSLVSAISSTQYLFIFLFALILYKYRPALLGEEINRRIAVQKIVAILLIIGGIFVIAL